KQTSRCRFFGNLDVHKKKSLSYYVPKPQAKPSFFASRAPIQLLFASNICLAHSLERLALNKYAQFEADPDPLAHFVHSLHLILSSQLVPLHSGGRKNTCPSFRVLSSVARRKMLHPNSFACSLHHYRLKMFLQT